MTGGGTFGDGLNLKVLLLLVGLVLAAVEAGAAERGQQVVDDVLARQDVLQGWLPARPLTVMQYRSLRGEYAMVDPRSHFTGLPNRDFEVPLEKLAAVFGPPLPVEKGTAIGRGYWWGQVDDGGRFTGVWIVVHTDRVRLGGRAQVRYVVTRPYTGHTGDSEDLLREGVTELVEWLNQR